MKRLLIILFISLTANTVLPSILPKATALNSLIFIRIALAHLGKKMINNDIDLERKNANYAFIKTLVSALKSATRFFSSSIR
jgi:hypothetical protein